MAAKNTQAQFQLISEDGSAWISAKDFLTHYDEIVQGNKGTKIRMVGRKDGERYDIPIEQYKAATKKLRGYVWQKPLETQQTPQPAAHQAHQAQDEDWSQYRHEAKPAAATPAWQKSEQAEVNPPMMPVSYLNTTFAERAKDDRYDTPAQKWGKEQVQSIKEKVSRRDQPLDKSLPASLAMTQGQWEDEVERSADVAAENAILNHDFVGSIFGDIENEAEAKTRLNDGIRENIYNNFGLLDANTRRIQEKAATKGQMMDARNVYARIKPKVKAYMQDYVKNNTKNIIAEAKRLKISPEDYAQTLSESIYGKIQGQLNEQLIRSKMPKSDAEYILSGVKNSIVGLLVGAISNHYKSDEEIQLEQEAEQRAVDAHSKEGFDILGYKLNGVNVAREVITFAADAPFFGISGKVSAYVVKKVAQREAAKLIAKGFTEKVANNIIARKLEGAIAKGALGKAGTKVANVAKSYLKQAPGAIVNLGVYNNMSTAARQLNQGYFDIMEYPEGWGSALLTGGALAGSSMLTRSLGKNIGRGAGYLNAGKRATMKTASFLTEAGAFATAEDAERWLTGYYDEIDPQTGKPREFTPVEDFLQSVDQLAVMKMTSGHGFRDKVYDPETKQFRTMTWEEQWKDMLEGPEKTMYQYKDKKGNVTGEIKYDAERGGVRFDEAEGLYLQQKVQAKELEKALRELSPEERRDKSKVEEARNKSKVKNLGQALEKIGQDYAPKEGETLDEATEQKRQQLKASYEAFMKDPDIPFMTKQKVALVLGGQINRNMPTPEGWDIIHEGDKVYGVTRDSQGNAIKIYNFKDDNEANLWTLRQGQIGIHNEVLEIEARNPEAAEQAMMYMIQHTPYPPEMVSRLVQHMKPASTTEQMDSQMPEGMDAATRDVILNDYHAALCQYAGIDETYQPEIYRKRGATVSATERHNAYVDMTEKEAALSDGTPAGERFKEQVVSAEDPSFTLQQIATTGTAEEYRKAVSYFNAKAKAEGMMDEMERSIDAQVRFANEDVDRSTNKELGRVLMVTDRKKTYFVTAGWVGYDETTGRIERERTDNSLIVRDAETGEIKAMGPQQLQVVMDVTPEELKEQNETQLREQLIDEADATVSYAEGTPTEPVAGDTFTGRDGRRYYVCEDPQYVADAETNQMRMLDIEEYRDAKSAEIDALRQAEAEVQQEQAAAVAEPQGAVTEGEASQRADEEMDDHEAEIYNQVTDAEGNATRVILDNDSEVYVMRGDLSNPEGEFEYGYVDENGDLVTKDEDGSPLIMGNEFIKRDADGNPMIETFKPFGETERPTEPPTEEELRMQAEAEAKAEEERKRQTLAQQREEELARNLVGYREGKPDIYADESTAEAGAEWFIREAEGDVKKAEQRVLELQRKKQEEIEKHTESEANEEKWAKLWADSATPEEQEQHQWALDEAVKAKTEAERQTRKLQRIHEVMMTPEALEQVKKERRAEALKSTGAGYHQAEKEYNDKSSLSYEDGQPIFAKMRPSQQDAFLEKEYGQGGEAGYLKDKKKTLKAEYDANQERISAIDRAISEYVEGTSDISDDAAMGISEEKGRLQHRQKQIEDEVMQISEMQKRADSRAYLRQQEAERQQKQRELDEMSEEDKAQYEKQQLFDKERDEQYALIDMAAQDRKNAIDDATDRMKLTVARQQYAGTAGEIYLDEDHMKPQTLEEAVSDIGTHMLAWDDIERDGRSIRGLRSELGTRRGFGKSGDTTGINDFLAARGQGYGIDEYVHRVWEGIKDDFPNASDTDVKEALLNVLSSSVSAKETRNTVFNSRLRMAEDAARREAEHELDMAMADEAERRGVRLSRRQEKEAASEGEAKAEANHEHNIPALNPATFLEEQRVQAETPETSQEELEEAKGATDTDPTDAQKEAGNYRKGHVTVGDMDMSVENPAGSERSGVDEDGKPWKQVMHYTYGYVRGQKGADGDHLDIFVNDAADLWHWNGTVYVVDQLTKDKKFDEHKVMYGFSSMEEAREAYLSNYSKDWKGLGTITGVPLEDFKRWRDSGRVHLEPFYQSDVAREAYVRELDKAYNDLREKAKGETGLGLADINKQMEDIRRQMKQDGITPPKRNAEHQLSDEGLGAAIKTRIPMLGADINELADMAGANVMIVTRDEFAQKFNEVEEGRMSITEADVTNGVKLSDGTILVAIDAEDITPKKITKKGEENIRKAVLTAVFGHELNHRFFEVEANRGDSEESLQKRRQAISKKWAPLVEKYLETIEKGRYQKIYKDKVKLYKGEIESIQKSAEKQKGEPLTDEEKEQIEKAYIDEEIAGDITGELMTDKLFVQDLVYQGRKEAGDRGWKGVFDDMRNVYRQFRKRFRYGMTEGERQTMKDIQKLITKAYRNAVADEKIRREEIRKHEKQAEIQRDIDREYQELAHDYVPDFNRGSEVEDRLREDFEEYMEQNAKTHGVVPFLAPQMKYGGRVRIAAHKMKGQKYVSDGGKRRLVDITPEAQMQAVREAAAEMAPMVPRDSVLVPIPSHTGKATDTLLLAQEISKLTGQPVMDVLEGAERRSNYEQKRRTGKSLTTEQMAMRMKEGTTLPDGKRIIYIDNVVAHGTTAKAAMKAGGYGTVLAYAYSGHLQNDGLVPLKSAELVTYGDNGQVIPLSERFNAESTDIRYAKKYRDMTPNEKNAYIDGIYEGELELSEEERKNVDKFLSDYKSNEWEDDVFPVISVDKHSFETNQKDSQLKKQMISTAEANNIIRTYSDEDTNGKGVVVVSRQKIGKMLDSAPKRNDERFDIHLSLINYIPQLLKDSKIAEEYYGANKPGKYRNPRFGVNPNAEIKVLYGAIDYNGKKYRVKTTLRGDVRSKDKTKNLYTYRIEDIELVGSETRSRFKEGSTPLNTNSISAAKLLNKVEKSYQKGNYFYNINKNSDFSLSKREEQIHSENFKKWFGDWEKDPEHSSKIVNEKGEPLEVYHDTNSTVWINKKTGQNFDDLDWKERDYWQDEASQQEWEDNWEEQDFYTFDNSKHGRQSVEVPGFFFAPKEDPYHEYGNRTIKAYLNIKNPIINPEIPNRGVSNTAGRDAMEEWMKRGYDGMIRTDKEGNAYEYVAFRPNQIKSATENVGTFDANNPDIRYQKRNEYISRAESPEDFDKIYDKAAKSNGVVAPDLQTKQFKIVDIERHDFKGTGKQAIAKAKNWAVKNLVGEHVAHKGTDEEFKYYISDDLKDGPIGKILSSSATKKSANLGVHLAALKKLPEIIEESKEVEYHSDYIKNEGARGMTVKPSTKGDIIHRLVGAVRIDGDIYTAKTVLKEHRNQTFDPYTYEITKVELSISGPTTDDALDNSTFVLGAKLLKNINKTKENDKNLLLESQKSEILSSKRDFKERQAEIIQRENPEDKRLGEHTWVTGAEDILTFDEALDDFMGTPDYTIDDAKEAQKNNSIKVYSSYPIKNGVFVTPSKMEAQNYAGPGQVYSEIMSPDDIAWLDSMQGQVAKVIEANFSKRDREIAAAGNKEDLVKLIDSSLKGRKSKILAGWRDELLTGQPTIFHRGADEYLESLVFKAIGLKEPIAMNGRMFGIDPVDALIDTIKELTEKEGLDKKYLNKIWSDPEKMNYDGKDEESYKVDETWGKVLNKGEALYTPEEIADIKGHAKDESVRKRIDLALRYIRAIYATNETVKKMKELNGGKNATSFFMNLADLVQKNEAIPKEKRRSKVDLATEAAYPFQNVIKKLEDETQRFSKRIEEKRQERDANELSDSDTRFSIRKKEAPEKTGIGYKVFYRGKDGKLYPPMVANPNGEDTPVGVWLDADAAPVAGESKTGRPQVKQGGKGTQGGSGRLAYRPGWHLGEIPYALQFNRKDVNGDRTLFPKDFVWAEVEYAADKDYQEEAEKEGMTGNGKFRHSYAGLKRLPEDGYYRYRTNPNPETDPWIITGAMKVNKVLSREEVENIVRKAGREPQEVEGDNAPLFSKREEEESRWPEGSPERMNEIRMEEIEAEALENEERRYELQDELDVLNKETEEFYQKYEVGTKNEETGQYEVEEYLTDDDPRYIENEKKNQRADEISDEIEELEGNFGDLWREYRSLQRHNEISAMQADAEAGFLKKRAETQKKRRGPVQLSLFGDDGTFFAPQTINREAQRRKSTNRPMEQDMFANPELWEGEKRAESEPKRTENTQHRAESEPKRDMRYVSFAEGGEGYQTPEDAEAEAQWKKEHMGVLEGGRRIDDHDRIFELDTENKRPEIDEEGKAAMFIYRDGELRRRRNHIQEEVQKMGGTANFAAQQAFLFPESDEAPSGVVDKFGAEDVTTPLPDRSSKVQRRELMQPIGESMVNMLSQYREEMLKAKERYVNDRRDYITDVQAAYLPFDREINELNKAIKFYRDFAKGKNDRWEDHDGILWSKREEDIHSDNFKKWFGDWEKDPGRYSKREDEEKQWNEDMKALGWDTPYEGKEDVKSIKDIAPEDRSLVGGDIYLNAGRRAKALIREEAQRSGMSPMDINRIPEAAIKTVEKIENRGAQNEAEADLVRFARRIPLRESGESDVAYRERITQAQREEKRQTDYWKKDLVNRIMAMVDDKNLTQINRSQLRHLLNMVRMTRAKFSDDFIAKAEALTTGMTNKLLQRQIDSLLRLKTQDVNGKNMSIAKNVDDNTRQIIGMLQGQMADLKVSGYEGDMTELRRRQRSNSEQIKKLQLQIDRGDLDKYKEDDAIREIERLKGANTSISIELQDLKAKKEDIEKDKLSAASLLNIDEEIKALQEKADRHAEAEAYGTKNAEPFTQSDARKLTAMTILKAYQKVVGLRNQAEALRRNTGEHDDNMSRLTNPDDVQPTDRIHTDAQAKVELLRSIEQQIKEKQEDVLRDLTELVEGGKGTLLNRIEAENDRKIHMIRGMFKDIGGKGGKDLSSMTKKDLKKRNKENSSKQFFTAQLGSFEYMAGRIARNSLSKDGWFYKHFVKGEDGVISARNQYLLGLEDATRTMNDKCQEIFGKPLEDVVKANSKETDKCGVSITHEVDGMMVDEPLKLSKAQATYIYMVWKMRDGRAKLMNQGFTEKSIGQIREFIGDENAEWADWVQDTYLADLREKYNEKYIEMYNTSMANIENYVPLKIDGEDVHQESGLSDDNTRQKKLEERAGSLINRTQNLKAVDLTASAYDVVMSHVNQMEEWNAFARVRRDLDYILSSDKVRKQLNANTAGQWGNLIDAAAIATHVYHPEYGNGIDKVMGMLTKGLAGGNIAWRYTTALKQMLSVPAFYGYSQDPRFMAALTKNIFGQYIGNTPAVASTMATFGLVGGKRSFKKTGEGKFSGLTSTFNWCVKNCPGFKERIQKGTAGNYILDDATLGKALDKYLEHGMVANQMIDAITCSIGIKSIYDYEMARAKARIQKSGMTDNEKERAQEEAHRMAINNADIYYNGTQQSNDAAFLSPMQMSRSMLDRALSLYQNASIGYSRKFATSVEDLYRMRHWGDIKENLIAQGMTEAQANKHMAAEATKSVVGFALYGFLLNALWDWGGKGFLGLFQGDEDDQEKDEETLSGKFNNATNGKWKDIAAFVSLPMRGQPGFNSISNLLSGTLSSPLLVYDAAEEFKQNAEKVAEKNGVMSLQMASLVGNRALRYGGIDMKVWTNVYLGMSSLVKAGWNGTWKDEAKMVDLMLILNTPNTGRITAAKNLYKDEPTAQYQKNVLKAMKCLDDADDAWAVTLGDLTGCKALTKKKEVQLYDELLMQEMTPEEKEKIRADKMASQKLKELTDLSEMFKAYDSASEADKDKLSRKIKEALEQKKWQNMTPDEKKEARRKALYGTSEEKKNLNNVYLKLSNHNDVVEDAALQELLDKLKPTYDDYEAMEGRDDQYDFYLSHREALEAYERLKDARTEINGCKKDMKDSPEDAQNLMKQLRKVRNEALRSE